MSSKCKCSTSTSIGKKQIMGVTGLLLCGFLVAHLLGNLTLLVSSDVFNKYSHTLTSNPLIYGAEAVLLLIFLSHIFMAVRLIIENKKARPIPYHTYKKSGRGGTFASSTMPLTGLIALVFLVIHILGLKYGTHYTTTVGGVEMRDIYKTTVEYFADPIHVFGYLVAVVALGIHTSHGFWSAFQSLGLNHPKYMPKIQCASKAFGLFVAIGFSIFPLFCYFQGGH
ncbi:MAG: succinate dehydrogenase cytochrome b subunit [Bacteriovorax sp.]|jgi:succinate dehydrogenase / fumarate reductase cytochrome b subunit|nr:succinate dehydrogenase cytochrome b subunit [Bacteriovorax sp.]